MQMPTTLSLLYDFIPWLKARNQRTPRPPGAQASEDKRSLCSRGAQCLPEPPAL